MRWLLELLWPLERDSIGEPSSDEQFNEYLQLTALLSANCPSPNLRGHAHFVTSTILRSHPDENVRLAFIRDTLESCPFESLKVSAVGWIKGETIEANPPTPLHGHQGERSAKEGETSIFRDTTGIRQSLGMPVSVSKGRSGHSSSIRGLDYFPEQHIFLPHDVELPLFAPLRQASAS